MRNKKAKQIRKILARNSVFGKKACRIAKKHYSKLSAAARPEFIDNLGQFAANMVQETERLKAEKKLD